MDKVQHFAPNFKTIFQSDVDTLCGLNSKENYPLYATNYFKLVTCPKCIELYQKKKVCPYCGAVLTESDLNDSNAFILSCPDHKTRAQDETIEFFKRYPDFTKWNKL